MAEDLVVGLGNRLRGDDAAGLEAAAAVRRLAPDLLVVEHEREPTDLIGIWEDARVAIVIDALRGADPGRVHRFELGSGETPLRRLATASTHALGLGEVIELASSLNRLPDRLVVFGVEGRCFDTGAPMSSPVRGAVEEVAERALAELGSPVGH